MLATKKTLVKRYVPRNMMPVPSILVYVVPNRDAIKPPTNGVHVLFKETAEMRRLNSVFEVPSSLPSFDLRGPRIYDALRG
jgi:hypothetical protein